MLIQSTLFSALVAMPAYTADALNLHKHTPATYPLILCFSTTGGKAEAAASTGPVLAESPAEGVAFSIAGGHLCKGLALAAKNMKVCCGHIPCRPCRCWYMVLSCRHDNAVICLCVSTAHDCCPFTSRLACWTCYSIQHYWLKHVQSGS